MTKFILKGLLRDRGRSLIPLLVVAIGVMLTVFMHGYINGIMGEMIEKTASFNTGHVKVMTRAYAANLEQNPNDLAITGVSELSDSLKKLFPDMQWESRIRFGGLIDVPDENGVTRIQAPAMGMGIDLLSSGSNEAARLELPKSIVTGQLPTKPGEMLISDDFARKLGVGLGSRLTLISSTMNGEMAFYNFTISGTVRFGNNALDRGTVIVDLKDAQNALDMQDAAGEILGFFPEGYYTDDVANVVRDRFNSVFGKRPGDFAPVMQRLRDQEGLSLYVDMSKNMGFIIIFAFIIAMSLVLWNAGLLGALRRYGEMGVRLAIGERKDHIYLSMIIESLMIGIAGTILGTAFGLGLSWLMQIYGINISEFTKNATAGVMMPNVMRSRITQADFYIGAVPGVLSTLAGTLLAGLGIYKRKTAQLFKELEA
jgi:putative ABC transport system permease protein